MEYIYAALLLHKLGKELNEENVKKVLASTGMEVDESKVKSMLVSLSGVDIDKELETASLITASHGNVSAGETKAEKKEEKPKEEKREAAAEGLSALFG